MDSLQKSKTLDQATRKRNLFDLQKGYSAPDTQMHIAGIDNRFSERLKSLFVQAKLTQTLCIWVLHIPNENYSAIVMPTIRGECTTHCNCSQKCHTCKQKKSILVEMFDFAVTQFDNFCKNELITVMFIIFDGKDTSLGFFKPKRQSNLCV